MLTPDIQAKLNVWRQKAVEGTLSIEEMTEAIKLLRDNRTSAAASAASTKRASAKAAIPDADSLLDELGGL